MAVEWTSVVAAASVGGAVAFFGRLAYDGVKRKNGNGVSGLKAHNNSWSAHQDIRDDITKIDKKLDGIGKTSNRILAHLTTRHGTS